MRSRSPSSRAAQRPKRAYGGVPWYNLRALLARRTHLSFSVAFGPCTMPHDEEVDKHAKSTTSAGPTPTASINDPITASQPPGGHPPPTPRSRGARCGTPRREVLGGNRPTPMSKDPELTERQESILAQLHVSRMECGWCAGGSSTSIVVPPPPPASAMRASDLALRRRRYARFADRSRLRAHLMLRCGSLPRLVSAAAPCAPFGMAGCEPFVPRHMRASCPDMPPWHRRKWNIIAATPRPQPTTPS